MSEITKHFAKALGSLAALSLFVFLSTAHADEPGRGATASFERDYLAFIINHHYSALRITELAAGTDVQRDAPINNPQEGTSPTPDTSPTPAKASDDDIKSMARAANRMQREEINKAQHFLREWYGVEHTPQLSPEGQRLIQTLEQTGAGAQFDQAFLKLFSNHHYQALLPSQDCQVKADIRHDQLKHYCEGIVEMQTRDINDMREKLCKKFSICDFQPGVMTNGQAVSAAGNRQ